LFPIQKIWRRKKNSRRNFILQIQMFGFYFVKMLDTCSGKKRFPQKKINSFEEKLFIARDIFF
jgi:hypothetical protein